VCLSVCTDLTHVMPRRVTACHQTSHLLALNFTRHAMPPVLLPPHRHHRSISSPLLSLLLSFASKKPRHCPPIPAPRASGSPKQAVGRCQKRAPPQHLSEVMSRIVSATHRRPLSQAYISRSDKTWTHFRLNLPRFRTLFLLYCISDFPLPFSFLLLTPNRRNTPTPTSRTLSRFP